MAHQPFGGSFYIIPNRALHWHCPRPKWFHHGHLSHFVHEAHLKFHTKEFEDKKFMAQFNQSVAELF